MNNDQQTEKKKQSFRIHLGFCGSRASTLNKLRFEAMLLKYSVAELAFIRPTVDALRMSRVKNTWLIWAKLSWKVQSWMSSCSSVTNLIVDSCSSRTSCRPRAFMSFGAERIEKCEMANSEVCLVCMDWLHWLFIWPLLSLTNAYAGCSRSTLNLALVGRPQLQSWLR